MGVFTISDNGTVARLSFDTKTLPDGPLQFRISAFNRPAGDPTAREIVAMPPRTWNIGNQSSGPKPEQPGQFPDTMDPPSSTYVQPTDECTPLDTGTGVRNCTKFAASIPHILPAQYIGKTGTDPSASSCSVNLTAVGMLELLDEGATGGQFRVWPAADNSTGKTEWNTLASTKHADGVTNLTEEYRVTDNVRNVSATLTWRGAEDAAGPYSISAASTNPLLKSFTCINMHREQNSSRLPKSDERGAGNGGWDINWDHLRIAPEDTIRVTASGVDMHDANGNRMIPLEIHVPVTGVSQTFRFRFEERPEQTTLPNHFGLRTGAMAFRIDNKTSRTITAVRFHLRDATPVSPQGNSSHPGYAHWHLAAPGATPAKPTITSPGSSYVFISTDMKETLITGSHASLQWDLLTPGQSLTMGGSRGFGIHQYEDQGQNRSFDLAIEPVFLGQHIATPPVTGPAPKNPNPAPLDGRALYAANCAGCHRALGETAKRGRTAAEITRAIANVNIPEMKPPYLKPLTEAEIRAIADVLANPTAALSRQPMLAQNAEGFGIRRYGVTGQPRNGKAETALVDAAHTMLVAQLFSYPKMGNPQLINTAARMKEPGHTSGHPASNR